MGYQQIADPSRPEAVRNQGASNNVHFPFAHLPSELILQILQELHPNDLLSLAVVSRRLHNLALETYFKQNSLDISSEVVVLQDKETTIRALPGLAIALSVVDVSLTHLSCDLTTKFDSPVAMIEEARALARYVSKISAVQSVSLQVMHPPFAEWEGVLLDLLNVILEKSCQELCVKSLESSTWAVSEAKTYTFSWPTMFPQALLPGNFFTKHKLFPRLRVCFIQALPLFLHSFYEQALNASSLTDLTFKYIFNSEGWAAFSGRISLPNLSRLTISHCAIIALSLRRFLVRHPSITFLDFHHNMLIPVHPSRLPIGVLPRLAELKTWPDYITHFLPALGTFPELASISFPIGDKLHQFTRVNDAFAYVATCTGSIRLSLCFVHAAGLDTWLMGDMSQHQTERGESTLHCVKTLELDSRISQGLSETGVYRLPQWFALFPAIETLYISRRCFHQSIVPDDFLKSVRAACPHINTVQLHSS